MKGSQELGCRNVGGYDTMKCSWCDWVAISVFLNILLMMVVVDQFTEWVGYVY